MKFKSCTYVDWVDFPSLLWISYYHSQSPSMSIMYWWPWESGRGHHSMEHYLKIRQFLSKISDSYLNIKGDSILILKLMTVEFLLKNEEVRFDVLEMMSNIMILLKWRCSTPAKLLFCKEISSMLLKAHW